MNGSEPTMYADAFDSELIALILSFICARLRSTSARLDSVSARLPPVSRWMASVITKNWNSGVPRRSAVSWRAASMVRPIFILSATIRNSTPTGPVISPATIPSVSVIGRPERRPRTMSSIASGKFELNFFTRRRISLPMTKCGPPIPKNRPTSIARISGAPLNFRATVTSRKIPMQIIAYLLSVMSLPVISRRLRSRAGFGIKMDAYPSSLPARWANNFRICACALPAITSPWRSLMSSIRRLTVFAGDGPRTAKYASATAPKPPIRSSHKNMCAFASQLFGTAPRPAPDLLRRGLFGLGLRQHRLQVVDERLGSGRRRVRVRSSAFVARMAEHHVRQGVERSSHLSARDFSHRLAKFGGLRRELRVEREDDVHRTFD